MALVTMGGCELGPGPVTVVFGDGCLFVTIDGKQHRTDSVALRVPQPEITAGRLYNIAVQQVTVVKDGESEDEDEEHCELGLALSGKDAGGNVDIAWVYSKSDLQSAGIRHSSPVMSSHGATVQASCFRGAADGAPLCTAKMFDHSAGRLRDASWRAYADVAAFRAGGPKPAWVSPAAAQCNVDVLASPSGPSFADLDALTCAVRTASNRKRAR